MFTLQEKIIMLKALKAEQKKWWKKSDPALLSLIEKLEQMIRNEQVNQFN